MTHDPSMPDMPSVKYEKRKIDVNKSDVILWLKGLISCLRNDVWPETNEERALFVTNIELCIEMLEKE